MEPLGPTKPKENKITPLDNEYSFEDLNKVKPKPVKEPLGPEPPTKTENKISLEKPITETKNKQTFFENDEIVDTSVTDYYGNKVKLKKTVAESFEKVAKELKDSNIDIKIADNYVSADVKKKAYVEYKKQLAEYNDKGYYTKGSKKIYSKPPKQAGIKSFHVHGQAIDLQQIDSMKNEKVYKVLRKHGFKQHPDEWWHWSIGEFTHDHDHS